jgi:hypothetical protein
VRDAVGCLLLVLVLFALVTGATHAAGNDDALRGAVAIVGGFVLSIVAAIVVDNAGG